MSLGVPDPGVMLSWSHDGGATWANPLERRLGGEGEYRTLVTLRTPAVVAPGHAPALGVRRPGAGGVPRRNRAAAQPSRPRQVGVRGGGPGPMA